MAKQNLKKRIAQETNEVRKAALVARLNPKKAGVLVNTSKDFPNNQEDVVISIDDDGNVQPEHVHGENCTHHH